MRSKNHELIIEGLSETIRDLTLLKSAHDGFLKNCHLLSKFASKDGPSYQGLIGIQGEILARTGVDSLVKLEEKIKNTIIATVLRVHRLGDDYLYKIFVDKTSGHDGGSPLSEQTSAYIDAVTEVIREYRKIPAGGYMVYGETTHQLFRVGRRVYLDGELLSSPHLDSYNDIFMEKLWSHQGETLTKNYMDKELRGYKKNPDTETPSFHKTIAKLGFTKEQKHWFFDVTKDTICFRSKFQPDTMKK